jgi:LysM repeat protein
LRTQLKLLLFLIVVGIATGTFALAWWMYRNIVSHDLDIASEITTMKKSALPPPDPGAHHFRTAVDLIQARQLDPARDGLYKLLRQFPRSPTTSQAKRIIGEMNFDALYAHDTGSGKRDYIVQPGDSLLAIATKNQTTLEAIARVNGLTSFNLQPGDHLFLIPMNFDLVVDVSSKKITITREGRFFGEYDAMALTPPPTMKIPASLEVSAKSATSPVDGKSANPVTIGFLDATKRITLKRKNATTASMQITTAKLAKAIPVQVTPSPEPRAKRATEVDADGNETAEQEVPTYGLFLASEDMEELYPLLRRGSSVTFVE